MASILVISIRPCDAANTTMPDFDLGDDAPSRRNKSTQDSRLQRAIVAWSHNGQERKTILIAKASVDAGRNQLRDICLRFEPSNDPSNYEKTKQISLHHFSLRYLGNGVEFVEAGSTNGSTVDQRPVESNAPLLVDRDVLVSIAGVLDLDLEPVFRRDGPMDGEGIMRAARANAANPSWLQERLIGEDKPGMIGFFRISRRNNLPDEQYLLLFHSGGIGTGNESLFRLSTPGAIPRRSRAFDVGDSVVNDPARLFVRDSAIWVERTGVDSVLVAGEPLEVGQSRMLATGALSVAGTEFSVTAK